MTQLGNRAEHSFSECPSCQPSELHCQTASRARMVIETRSNNKRRGTASRHVLAHMSAHDGVCLNTYVVSRVDRWFRLGTHSNCNKLLHTTMRVPSLYY